MTHEFKEIIEAYSNAKLQGLRAVLATVVDLEGSSYRKPGVQMLIMENNTMVGAVSGGCVEKEVLQQAQSVFETGTSKIITYDGRYRLGCEGILYILIETFAPLDEVVYAIILRFKSRKSFSIDAYYTRQESDKLIMGSVLRFEEEYFSFGQYTTTEYLNQHPAIRCFSYTMPPCFRLMIIGAEHDAVKLCELASTTGWEVHIITSPKDPKRAIDFPYAQHIYHQNPEELTLTHIDQQTAVVLMTHNFAKDLLYLKTIRDTLPAYIGLLGPANRREKLLNALIEYFPDIGTVFMDCIHGPAGLNIGAETPQEIAISIIAEILSVIRNQNVIPLQDKEGAIHAEV